jgi:hypothetical protein
MLCGIALERTSGRAESYDFTFSKGALRASEIFDSATSPPARYVIEVARRLADASPNADYLIVANPLLPLKASQLLGWLGGSINGPMVLSDSNGFPLLYCLPRSLFADVEKFLLTLSTVDGELDQRLLQGLSGRAVAHHSVNGFKLGSYPLSTATGWFQGSARQKIFKVTAANAVKIVEQRADWAQMPVAAFHPYHAGSIVFFAAASQHVTTPLVDRHVICSSYKDIVAASGNKLDPIWLKLPFLPRDGSVGEPQYFVHSLDRLGDAVVAENFLVFMRYSRISAVSPFHMIDHDRFSLGESLLRSEQLRQLQPPQPIDQCKRPTDPLKLLLHVTGGLPIKNYPLKYLQVLVRALTSLGVAVSIIGRPDLVPFGAQSIDAEETDRLMAAVREHHIFIGLDSFPHHFVRNVMGWPTIGLFGTTGAANFGGGWSSHYRALDAALACHPCGAERRCPVFSGHECLNYAPPEHLIAAILDMADQVYGFALS